MNREDAAKKLKKIKALAERGVGGERETALRMYEEMLQKYELEDEDALDRIERRWFHYKTDLEEKLLIEIFNKVIGSRECYVYTGPYRRRKQRGVDCTEAEALEIDFLFGFYKAELQKELEAFMLAFCYRNTLYPDETARLYEKPKKHNYENNPERNGLLKKAAFMSMSMDGKKPPKALIEENRKPRALAVLGG